MASVSILSNSKLSMIVVEVSRGDCRCCRIRSSDCGRKWDGRGQIRIEAIAAAVRWSSSSN